MKTFYFAMLLAVAIAASGCKSVGKTVGTALKNLKDDHATVVVYSPEFGTLIRANPEDTQDVEIFPNGSVKIIGHGTNAVTK